MALDFFKWENKYSVEIDEIDNQHKKIVHMLNELYTAFMYKEQEEKVEGIVSEMVSYTMEHLNNEERYFRKFNFSYSAEHMLEHKEFKEKVHGFQEKLAINKSALNIEMINFLRNWLMSHILVTDKKYTKCFQENGVR